MIKKVKKVGNAIPRKLMSLLLVILFFLNKKNDNITKTIDKILCLNPLWMFNI